MSWPTGEVIYRGYDVHRCCDVHRGSTSTGAAGTSPPGTPRTPAAFSPALRIVAERRRRCSTAPGDVDAAPIDTAPIDTALIDKAPSETVFHDLPVRGRKHLAHAQLVHRLGVALIARRDLLLVDLTSDGPRRLGLTRGELIESDSRNYPQTAAWARALHDHWQRVDGLLWASGQRDTSRPRRTTARLIRSVRPPGRRPAGRAHHRVTRACRRVGAGLDGRGALARRRSGSGVHRCRSDLPVQG